MKKKLFIGTVLPTVAALGVIGSGFSLWIFSDSNSVSTTGSVGINVTNVLTLKNTSIEVTNTDANLVFDQATKTLNPNAEGLHFDKMQTATFKSGSLQGYEVDWADNVKLTFTTTIFLPEAVASYVNLSSTLSGTFGEKTTVDNNYKFDGSDTVLGAGSTYTYTIDTNSITTTGWTSGSLSYEMFNFANITASYVDEPDELSDYTKMRTDVTSKTISVSYAVKAEIVSK